MTRFLKPFILLICLFLFFQCSAPKEKEKETSTDSLTQVFDRDFNKFFGHMNNEEWDKMMDMTNPQIFNIAPREALINMFKGQKGQGISMSINDIKINGYSDIMEFQGIYYTKISYEGTQRMELSEAIMSKIDLFKSELYKSYDKDDVKIDLDNNVIQIDATKQIIATSLDEKKSWKYLEIQEGQEQVMLKMLPVEVYDKLITNE
ncbi:MAG: hypothetical protein ACPGVD_08290 [Flavobacteriales bacterium]